MIGLASPLHNTLFRAGHSGPHSLYLVHAGRDALLALAVNLPLAALVGAALLRTRPWAAPIVDAWRRPRTHAQRFALQGALALVLIAPVAVFAQNGAQLATAGTGPGQPCPTQAPVKTYDVSAIDVDIPLNRFGDQDPNGKMYVLTKNIDAVRAQERTQHLSVGLKGNDPIQALVIRANLGDCVQIHFTNRASGGDYGIHIDGLAFDIDSSPDYRFWVPREPQTEGAHYIHPGAGFRNQVSHGLFGALAVEPAGARRAPAAPPAHRQAADQQAHRPDPRPPRRDDHRGVETRPAGRFAPARGQLRAPRGRRAWTRGTCRPRPRRRRSA